MTPEENLNFRKKGRTATKNGKDVGEGKLTVFHLD